MVNSMLMVFRWWWIYCVVVVFSAIVMVVRVMGCISLGRVGWVCRVCFGLLFRLRLLCSCNYMVMVVIIRVIMVMNVLLFSSWVVVWLFICIGVFLVSGCWLCV